jgi:HK97 family phage major capsid protein
MGRPVIPTQHAATLGQAGDISLCAMNKYLCATKSGGVESSSSIHLWFDQDATAFKFRMRVDGQPEMNSAISPRAGSNTLSAFVVTAVRT